MAAETLAPDAILASTNYTGAVTDIDEDPDSPDANWLACTDDTIDNEVRVSFPTPTGNPTTGAGLQEFRVLVRLSSGLLEWPTIDVELWENGSSVATLISGQNVTAQAVVSATWDASSLGTADGSLVECRVVGHTTPGSPANRRRNIEVGAIEWNVEYTAGGGGGSTVTATLTDALTFSDAFTRQGWFTRAPADSNALTDSLTSDLWLTRTLADNFTFTDSLSAARILLRRLADAFTFSDSVDRSGSHFTRTMSDFHSLSESLDATSTGSPSAVSSFFWRYFRWRKIRRAETGDTDITH